MSSPNILPTDPDGVAPLGPLGASKEELLAILLGRVPDKQQGSVSDMLSRSYPEHSSLDVGMPTMTSEQWNQPDAQSVDVSMGQPQMTQEQWNQPDAKSVDVSIGKPTLLNRDDGQGVSGVYQSSDNQVEHHPATGVDVSMGQPQMLNEAVSAQDPRAMQLILQQLAKAQALRQPSQEYAAATP